MLRWAFNIGRARCGRGDWLRGEGVLKLWSELVPGLLAGTV